MFWADVMYEVVVFLFTGILQIPLTLITSILLDALKLS